MIRLTILYCLLLTIFSGCNETNTDSTVVVNAGLKVTKINIAVTPPELDPMLFDSLALACFYHLGYSTGGEFYYKTAFESIHHKLIEILSEHGADHSDIIFLIDKTGSMQNDIDSVRINLNYIIDRVSLFNDVNLGVAAYGDRIVDGESWFSSSSLSQNYDETRNFINALTVSNGGDYPESVYDGLAKVILETDWRPDTKRMVLVIGDAPSLEDTLSNYSRKDILELCQKENVDANIFPVLVSPFSFEMLEFYNTFTQPISFEIYPNPAIDYITLKTNSDSVGYFKIITMSGEVILNEVITENETKFEFEDNMSPGTYLVKIEDKAGNFLKSEKLLITR